VQVSLSEADCIVKECDILNLFKRVCFHIGSGAHSACYSMWAVLFSSEGKAMGHRAEHTPQSSTKVTNEGSRTSTPLVCLHGVNRDNFTYPNDE
jgi:hypothetical protein